MATPQYNDSRYNNVESSTGGQRQFVTPEQTYRPQQRVEKPKPAPRMPKAQAQTLSRNLKKAVTVASVLGFGAFSGLIAYNQVHAATTTTTAATTTSSSTQSSQSTGSSSSFFNQQGGSNVGSSSTGSTSSSTGNSNSGSSSTGSTSSSTAAPVTGTSVS